MSYIGRFRRAYALLVLTLCIGATSADPPVDKLVQVRACLWKLRNYSVFVNNDEWLGAIRQLAEAGRDAVPDIVAELDGTQSDAEIRALAFALRAIGDPRACPALIKAVARTSVLSSDYGLNVADKELDRWVQAHQI